MRLFLQLMICFLLFGCKTETSKTDQSTTTSSSTDNAIPQWLTLLGEKEKPTIVLVSGDEEYRSEEALPQLAKILQTHHGFNCKVLFAQDPEKPGIINPNYLHNIPGLEQLAEADLMVIFTRFRALPDEQMKYIDAYLQSGKPVLGIRTATHAFNFKPGDVETTYSHYCNYHEADGEWQDGFGRLVLGEKWINHHGHHKHQSTVGVPATGQDNHPIWNGIGPADIWGPTDVYGVRLPLPGDSQPIVLGQVTNRAGDFNEEDNLYGMRPTDKEVAGIDEKRKLSLNDPMMPIAWTKSYQIPNGKKGKAFASTIGSSTDLLATGTRRLLVNASFWLLDLPVPENATVSLVGTYQPSAYAFVKEQHWLDKQLRVADLVEQ